MAGKTYTDTTLYRRLFLQLRSYRLHLVGIFLSDLLAAPLLLLSPLPLKIAIDSVVGSAPLPPFLTFLPRSITTSALALLAFAAILQVTLVLLSQLQDVSSDALRTYTGERLTLRFRSRLFEHIQRLSLAYHDLRGTADTVYRIQYDAPSVQHLTIYGALPLVTAVITLVAAIYVIARISLPLAIVAVAVCPLLLIFSRTYGKRMRPRYRRVKGMEKDALQVVQEVLTSLRVVKAFGRESDEQDRFVRHSAESMRARIRLSFAEGLFGLLINLTTAVGTAAVLFIGIRSVLAGILTIGELLMVIAYLTQLYSPLKTISKTAGTVQSSIVSLERSFELLDEEPDVTERADARSIVRANGAVSFRDVCFAYEAKHPVLHDISFEINPGTRVGIAGPTGTGKTTLISWLMRFYDPVSGEIMLDGTDLRDYRLADLRNQFSIVLQESVLFSTTIAENIAYGRPEADEQGIIEAAKAANADDFIKTLPDGYETQVGERGMRLSGGERQRISLARAFLNAPFEHAGKL